MEKKFLNEENYQKNSKGVLIAGIIVLVVGVVLGGFLLAKGIGGLTGAISGDANNEVVESTKYDDEIKEAEEEIKLLENQKEALEATLTGDMIDDMQINVEINDIDLEIFQLESDINSWEIQNESEGSKSNMKEEASQSFSSIFTIFGGLVLLGTGLGLGIKLILVAKARSILAYGAQTVVPIANEVMESAAPSIGKVAEEISKGVNAGKK